MKKEELFIGFAVFILIASFFSALVVNSYLEDQHEYKMELLKYGCIKKESE